MRLRVSVSFTEDDLMRLKALSLESGFNRSLVIRQLIKEAYEQSTTRCNGISKEISK